MKLLSEENLKEWLGDRGLLWIEDSGGIEFPSAASESRFWILPTPARRIVFFLNVLLDSIDGWERLLICKNRASGWYSADVPDGPLDAVHDQIVSSTGLPTQFEGAILAERGDYTAGLTLLFNQLLFGWCVWDDVYVVPDNAKQIIQTSHHDVVHVTFREASRVASFVEAMADQEFTLPLEVPDGTFKIPHWMARKSD